MADQNSGFASYSKTMCWIVSAIALLVSIFVFTGDTSSATINGFLWLGLAIVFGVNNVLDEDPSVCDSCGVINMSPVVHDLPGRVAYARLSFTMN